jgi:tetratricopeptide (TPR) repeat protein/tRNA A-37 threonylcarbamoyl transferase component Bud32
MGVVYKARDKQLHRVVALKFLGPRQQTSSDAAARFTREAQAIAALNHPHIATLFEAGEWDGEPFLALEFLPNGTLRDRIPAAGLPLAAILQYAGQIGAGLEFAHAQGILHRDIKPANCMFSQLDALKLVDFGLAKWSSAADITQAGSATGTVPYMAPELLNDAEATEQSDVYALGVTVYEMAAGHPMFSAERRKPLIRQILAGTCTRLSDLRPDLPASFLDAVTKATARNPRDRFASVARFLEALGCAPREPIPAILHSTQTMAPSVSHPPLERRRRWRAAALMLTCLALAGGAAYRWLGPRLRTFEATVVVLPFENLGGDPANQALCDGLQETVTSMLAHSAALRKNTMIVPSSDVRRNHIATIADARKQFRADLTLTGSVQRNQEAFQLTLSLSDASTGRLKDSRIIAVPANDAASLQPRLNTELPGLFGVRSPASTELSAANTTHNSQAYDLYLRGRGAVESRNIDPAIAFLRKSLELDPDFAPARAKLAEAYLRENLISRDPKWLSEAEAEASRAAHSGLTPDLLWVQAMVRKQMGDVQTAIQLFHKALESDPDNIESYRNLAEALDTSGRTDEAIKVYQQAIDLRPGYWPTYITLGDFYFRKHDYPKAEQTLLKGLSFARDNYILNANLGALYFEQSRWEDAARCFEQSIASKPNAVAYSNLGTVRFFERQYEVAARQFRQATRLQEANPVNWGNLGDALWQLKAERAHAIEAYQKAALLASEQLALNQGNWRLRKSYALYLAKLGRAGEAIAEIEKVQVQAPRDAQVQLYAARVYATTGDPVRAEAAIKRCLDLGITAGEIASEPDFAPFRNTAAYRDAHKQHYTDKNTKP